MTGQGGVAELIAQSEALNSLNRAVEARDFGANIARDIARADLHLKPSEFLLIWAAAIVGVPIVMFSPLAVPAALGSPLLLLFGALMGFLLPRFWLAAARAAGSAPSTSSFPTRSPSSPTPCAPGPRSSRRSSWSSANRGRRSRPSSAGSSARSTSVCRSSRPSRTWSGASVDDLELMATAISIQHQVGGNLAEILDSIAYTIRERVRIKGEIRTLTAQQRLSGYVVADCRSASPAFLFVAAPGFMAADVREPAGILGLPAGVIILGIGGFMMFIGFLIIRRVVDIEV